MWRKQWEINGVTPEDIAYRLMVDNLENWDGYGVIYELLADEGVEIGQGPDPEIEKFAEEVLKVYNKMSLAITLELDRHDWMDR